MNKVLPVAQGSDGSGLYARLARDLGVSPTLLQPQRNVSIAKLVCSNGYYDATGRCNTSDLFATIASDGKLTVFDSTSVCFHRDAVVTCAMQAANQESKLLAVWRSQGTDRMMLELYTLPDGVLRWKRDITQSIQEFAEWWPMRSKTSLGLYSLHFAPDGSMLWVSYMVGQSESGRVATLPFTTTTGSPLTDTDVPVRLTPTDSSDTTRVALTRPTHEWFRDVTRDWIVHMNHDQVELIRLTSSSTCVHRLVSLPATPKRVCVSNDDEYAAISFWDGTFGVYRLTSPSPSMQYRLYGQAVGFAADSTRLVVFSGQVQWMVRMVRDGKIVGAFALAVPPDQVLVDGLGVMHCWSGAARIDLSFDKFDDVITGTTVAFRGNHAVFRRHEGDEWRPLPSNRAKLELVTALDSKPADKGASLSALTKSSLSQLVAVRKLGGYVAFVRSVGTKFHLEVWQRNETDEQFTLYHTIDHATSIDCCALSASGPVLLAFCSDGRLYVVDMETKQVQSTPVAETSTITACSFLDDQGRVACDGMVFHFSRERELTRLSSSILFPGSRSHSNDDQVLRFSDTGRMVAMYYHEMFDDSTRFVLWDLERPRHEMTLASSASNSVDGMYRVYECCLKDVGRDTFVAICSSGGRGDGVVDIYRRYVHGETVRSQRRQFLPFHKTSVTRRDRFNLEFPEIAHCASSTHLSARHMAMAFSSDGKWFAFLDLTTPARMLRIYDLQCGGILQTQISGQSEMYGNMLAAIAFMDREFVCVRDRGLATIESVDTQPLVAKVPRFVPRRSHTGDCYEPSLQSVSRHEPYVVIAEGNMIEICGFHDAEWPRLAIGDGQSLLEHVCMSACASWIGAVDQAGRVFMVDTHQQVVKELECVDAPALWCGFVRMGSQLKACIGFATKLQLYGLDTSNNQWSRFSSDHGSLELTCPRSVSVCESPSAAVAVVSRTDLGDGYCTEMYALLDTGFSKRTVRPEIESVDVVFLDDGEGEIVYSHNEIRCIRPSSADIRFVMTERIMGRPVVSHRHLIVPSIDEETYKYVLVFLDLADPARPPVKHEHPRQRIVHVSRELYMVEDLPTGGTLHIRHYPFQCDVLPTIDTPLSYLQQKPRLLFRGEPCYLARVVKEKPVDFVREALTCIPTALTDDEARLFRFKLDVTDSPLEIALEMGDEAKADAIVDAFVAYIAMRADCIVHVDSLQGIGPTITTFASTHPRLVLKLLQVLLIPAPNCVTFRQSGKSSVMDRLFAMLYYGTKPQFRAHEYAYEDRLWEEPLSGKGTETRMASYIVGTRAFGLPNGPYAAIVRSGYMPYMETPVMEYMTKYKWNSYGRSRHTTRLTLYIAVVGFYLFGMVIMVYSEYDRTWLAWSSNEPYAYVKFFLATSSIEVVPLVGLLLWGPLVDDGGRVYRWMLGLLPSRRRQLPRRETRKQTHFNVIHTLRAVAHYPWEICEGLTYLGIFVSYLSILQHSHTAHVVCGWTVVLLTINLINLLRPYERTGTLIRMLTQILYDMRVFVLLLVLMSVGTSVALMVMLMRSQPPDGAFRGFMSLLTGYQMMLGAWDVGDLTDDTDEGGAGTTLHARVVFVMYTSMVMIVALNLLIAIMGDSYDRVRENERLEGICQLAKVVERIDMQVAKSGTASHLIYVHALVPSSDGTSQVDEHRDEWEGRVKALTREIKRTESRLEATFQDTTAAMRADTQAGLQDTQVQLRTLQTQVDEHARATDTRLQRLESSLERLEASINRIADVLTLR